MTVSFVLLTVLTLSGCDKAAIDPEMDLSDAASSGDSVSVRSLLDNGANPDEPIVTGLTPLMRAANRDHAEVVQMLIDAGADVHALSDGLTAVHVAAGAEAVASLSVLLDAGADPTVRSRSGMNALDHAASAGATETLETLVRRADLEVDQPSMVVTQGHGYPRESGPTPLALAVASGRIESTRALLALGADVDALSSAGHTPLLLAVFLNQSPELVEILLDHGASLEAAAACQRGCSVGRGRALTVKEWAEALERKELTDLIASRSSTS